MPGLCFAEMCNCSEAGSYVRWTFVSLNSRLECNKDKESSYACLGALDLPRGFHVFFKSSWHSRVRGDSVEDSN